LHIFRGRVENIRSKQELAELEGHGTLAKVAGCDRTGKASMQSSLCGPG